MKVLVAGAGGFIGGHLVGRLISEGDCDEIVAVDVKPFSQWHQVHSSRFTRVVNFDQVDVGESGFLIAMTDKHFDAAYNFAADMGGMGFISNHKVECMLSVKTSLNVLRSALENGWGRVFFASSACVYPAYAQESADVVPLAEQMAYPADPEDGYGWEKLFSERLYRHYFEDFGLVTRVARYHNIYGPHGTWDGGREKAPAAICRKVAIAALTGGTEIEIWGDGEQTRSFAYIDDCIDGTRQLMESDFGSPLNIGSDELVTINQLVSIVEEIAGLDDPLERVYVDGPQGVRGRNSDNTMVREVLGWEPQITLRNGLEETYRWIYDRVKESL